MKQDYASNPLNPAKRRRLDVKQDLKLDDDALCASRDFDKSKSSKQSASSRTKNLRCISNIPKFRINIRYIRPRVQKDTNEYYFEFILDDNTRIKTDKLTIFNTEWFNKNIKLDKEKLYDYIEEIKDNDDDDAQIEYICDELEIQDIIYFILDDKNIFRHNKFDNVYYTSDFLPINLYKENDKIYGPLIEKFYNKDVHIISKKHKRKYKNTKQNETKQDETKQSNNLELDLNKLEIK